MSLNISVSHDTSVSHRFASDVDSCGHGRRKQKEEAAMIGESNNNNNLDPYHALNLNSNKSTDKGSGSG